ncbi:MAG: MarC family protein [Bdellovibrionota bacterium]
MLPQFFATIDSSSAATVSAAGTHTSFLVITFVSLLSTVNPLGATSFFLSHPSTSSSVQLQRATAKKASYALLIALLLFSIAGETLFTLMGISVPAFQIAGGVFVFRVALDMLKGKHVRSRTLPEEQAEAYEEDDIAIIPLGLPLLAGPGSITMVIVLMAKANGWVEMSAVIGMILAVSLITYLILRNSSLFLRYLKPSGIRIMNRIMGLIIAAIAAQLLIDGICSLLPKMAAQWAQS